LFSIAAAAGTDEFGTAYQEGVSVGSQIINFGTTADGADVTLSRDGNGELLIAGTNAILSVKLTDSTGTPAAAPIGSSRLLSKNGYFQFFSEDGNIYDMSRLELTPSSPLTVAQTAFEVIPGLSMSVAANILYHVEGKIIFQGQQSAGNALFQWDGPAISGSDMRLVGKFWPDSGTGISFNGANVTALGSNMESAPLVLGTEFVLEFDGHIVFSAAGTLSMETACTVATDTFNIRAVGSYMRVTPSPTFTL
jgi:hypothetical protein